MNWTGGRLRGSKRRGNSLSVEQKNHFAKARTRLHGSPKANLPICFSFFEHGENKRETSTQKGPEIAVESKKLRLRNVEEFEGAASTIPRRELLQNSDPEAIPWLSRNQNWLHGSRVVEPHSHTNRGKSPPPFFKATSFPDNIHGIGTQVFSGYKKYDCRPMSEGDLEAKRQELLSRSDWLGPTTTRPLKMKFPSIEVKDRVGRRRRLTKEDLERRRQGGHSGSRWSSTRAPNIMTRQASHIKQKIHHGLISVRIGSSTNRTSSSQRSSDCYSTHQKIRTDFSPDKTMFNPIEAADQLQKSDEMLLKSIHSSDDTAPMLLDSENDQVVSMIDCPQVDDPLTRPLKRYSVSGDDESPDNEEDMEGKRCNYNTESVKQSNLALAHTRSRNDDHTPVDLQAHSSPSHTFSGRFSIDNVHVDERSHDDSQRRLVEFVEDPNTDRNNTNSMIHKTSLSVPKSRLGNYKEKQTMRADKGWEQALEKRNGVKGEDKKCNVLSTDGSPVTVTSSIGDSLVYFPESPKPESAVNVIVEENTDENAAWWKFVFGDEENEDEEKLCNVCCSDTASAIEIHQELINGQSSMVVEASDMSINFPGVSTPTKNKNLLIDTSPDPLALDRSPLPRSLPPKIIFKKPVAFKGHKSHMVAVSIGRNIGKNYEEIAKGRVLRKLRRGKRKHDTDSEEIEI